MKTKWLVLDTVLLATVKEGSVAIVGLWLLPEIGINVPLWAVGLVAVALAAQSYYSHVVTVRLQRLRPVTGIETMVGRRCVTAGRLAPEGYVKIDGELWQARSGNGVLDAGREAVVIAVEGLRLLVKPPAA